jgi:hypothetical protein
MTLVSIVPALTCLSIGLSDLRAVTIEYAAPATVTDPPATDALSSPVVGISAPDNLKNMTTLTVQARPSEAHAPLQSFAHRQVAEPHIIPIPPRPSIPSNTDSVKTQVTPVLIAHRHEAGLAAVLPSVVNLQEPANDGRAQRQPPVVESTAVTYPWDAAAGAGVAIGTGTRKAAVKTAGLFTRFGKSIAGAF